MALAQFDPKSALTPGRYTMENIFSGLSTSGGEMQVEKWDWYDTVYFPTDSASNLKAQSLVFFAVPQGGTYTIVLNTDQYQKDISDTNLQTANLSTYGFVCTGMSSEIFTSQMLLGTAGSANHIGDFINLHAALIRNIQLRLSIDTFPYDTVLMTDAPAAGGPSGAIAIGGQLATVRVDSGFVSNGIPSTLNQRSYIPVSAYDMTQPLWIPPNQVFNVVATFGQQCNATNMATYKPTSTVIPAVAMRIWLRGWRVRLSQA
jgi:hypothetical protein